MFAKMCFSSVNGACPIQGAPSPPMCVKVAVLRSIHTAMKWQPMPAVARLPFGAAPLAVVVEFADDARRALSGVPGVELFLDLVLDHLALFLHHQDLLQALGEAARALRLERPGHPDLVDPQADVARDALVDAQIRERLHHVAEGFAGGRDPQSWFFGIPDDF